MIELNRTGYDYDESFQAVLDQVNDMQRSLAGLKLAQHPWRDIFLQEAGLLYKSLNCSHVQINAIMNDVQITIVTHPDKLSDYTLIPIQDSLCVLTVGLNKPLCVTDIKNDDFLSSHSSNLAWSAWASVPIMIDGYSAGTVCALEENKPRKWSRVDEESMQRSAHVISEKVSTWRT